MMLYFVLRLTIAIAFAFVLVGPQLRMTMIGTSIFRARSLMMVLGPYLWQMVARQIFSYFYANMA